MRNYVRFFVAAVFVSLAGAPAFAVLPAACTSDDDRDKAIASCTAVIESAKTSKDDMVAALKRRAILRSWSERDESLADIERALLFRPRDSTLYALRAEHRGEYDGEAAIADMDKAIEISPKHAGHRIQRAKLYQANGDYRAEEDFSEAIKLDPKNPDMYSERLGYYRDRHEFEKALADANSMIALGKSEMIVVRAQMQMFLHRFSEAHAELDTLISSKEFVDKNTTINAAYAYGMRGYCNMVANQAEKAVADYSRSITAFDVRATRQLRGNAFVKMKQYELAIQDYTQALKDMPNDVATLYLRAIAYDLNGQPKHALADRTEAAAYVSGLKQPLKN